jgi:PRTRC system protein E
MFFTQIHQTMIEGVDLSFVIRKQADSLVVSVLPKSGSLKGDAANNIIPLVVNGTPAELDAGFIQAAFRPLQRVQGLITNIAQFEQQAEKTAVENKQSKGRSNKPSNETKEEIEKRERYEKALKRADELIAAKSFEDALISLQQARLYAPSSQTKGIDDKIASAKQRLNQGSLFDVAPTAEQRPQSPISPTSPISQQQVAAVPTAPQAKYTHVQQRQAVPAAYTENGYTECETRYPQAMAAGETGGMPAYDNPEYPPSYRPEEYAEYPDFPQNMVAPSHAQANPNTQIF